MAGLFFFTLFSRWLSILPPFGPTSGLMQDEPDKPRNDMGWGIPASILVHVVLAAILIFGLPLELPQPPEEEEAVSVEIVEPPPEPEPPEPEPPEAEEPEPPAPPEPEPPAQEEEAEPAPEPPPAPEQPEPQTEPEAPAAAAPTPVLRPVIEFGEETTGPEVSADGDASAEERAPPEPTEEPAEVVEPEAPDVLAAVPDSSPDAAAAAAAPAPPEAVEAAPEAAAEAESAEMPLVALTEATTLFSEAITDDPVAQTAMGNLPRGLRATQLCETELTEQLRNAAPSRDPDFIPRSPLADGNILELRQTAFRSQGQWYDLSFRCEINEDATKVMGFAFKIGAPVPRSEWRGRGFPGS